jgi:tRNA(Ile)-lysidine synthase
MTGPAPAIAHVRSAVRACINDVEPGSLVLVAVSGGRDSLAVADALAFEAPKLTLRAGALIVDHQLQEESARVAAEVQRVVDAMGLTPVQVLTVEVDAASNVEANARDARYAALTSAAERLDADAVLLGHTLDDQAESVLLGLARGSGAKSLAGMAERRGIFRRPLLSIDRATTGEACAAAGLSPWDDPHNVNPAFSRVRVRHELMPVLERELGPGVASALARSATQLRDDDDALDAWAKQLWTRTPPEEGLDCEELASLPVAVVRRVIRFAALSAGVTPGALRYSQLKDLEALVTDWRGQGAVALPGGVAARRSYGRLTFGRGDPAAPATETSAAQLRE